MGLSKDRKVSLLTGLGADRQVAAAGLKALVKVESETGGGSRERGGSSVGTEDKAAKLCTVITIE